MLPRDPYDLLGLAPPVSEAGLHAAYRRRAMEWHPDRNPRPEAAEMFRDIHEAYLFLKDPERRAWYERERDRLKRERAVQAAQEARERFWKNAEARSRLNPENLVTVFAQLDGLLRRVLKR